MPQLYGLHEALIEQHNEKMAVIARLEILIRILQKKKPDDIVAQKELKSFAGTAGFVNITAAEFIEVQKEKRTEEYKVLDVIKEMIQEGGIMTP